MGRIARLIKSEIEKYILSTVEAHYSQNQLCYHYDSSGVDAPPLPSDRVVLVQVEGTNNFVSAGVLSQSQGAEPGERISYSRNDDGESVSLIYQKKDGSIEIESKQGKVKITADGDGKLKVICDGDINLESSGNITVKGDTKITGGKCEIGGTVSPTGSGALCGIPYCPYTGAPQTGNISQGT